MSGSLFDQYKAALRRGHLAAVAGDLDGALEAYQDASMLVPERALPIASQGTVLHRLDRWPEAAEAFDVALQLAPDDEASLRARATAREERGMWSAAAADYERLALVLDVASRSAAAAAAARRAVELEPTDRREALAERLATAAAHLAERRPPRSEPAPPSAVSEDPASPFTDELPADDPSADEASQADAPTDELSPEEPSPDDMATDEISPDVQRRLDAWAAMPPDDESAPRSEAGAGDGDDAPANEATADDNEETATDSEETADDAPAAMGRLDAASAALAARLAELGTQPDWVDPGDLVIAARSEPDGEGRLWPAVDLPSPPPPPIEGPPPDPETLLAEAADLIDAGDIGGARNRMLVAVMVHRAAGRLDAALEVCLQLLTIAPGDSQVHLAIANLQLDRGWTALATEKIDLLLRLTGLTGDTQAEADVHGLAAERLRDDPVSADSLR